MDKEMKIKFYEKSKADIRFIAEIDGFKVRVDKIEDLLSEIKEYKGAVVNLSADIDKLLISNNIVTQNYGEYKKGPEFEKFRDWFNSEYHKYGLEREARNDVYINARDELLYFMEHPEELENRKQKRLEELHEIALRIQHDEKLQSGLKGIQEVLGREIIYAQKSRTSIHGEGTYYWIPHTHRGVKLEPFLRNKNEMVLTAVFQDKKPYRRKETKRHLAIVPEEMEKDVMPFVREWLLEGKLPKWCIAQEKEARRIEKFRNFKYPKKVQDVLGME
jgi:hypothetical protein